MACASRVVQPFPNPPMGHVSLPCCRVVYALKGACIIFLLLCRKPEAGCRMPEAGCRMPDAGTRVALHAIAAHTPSPKYLSTFSPFHSSPPFHVKLRHPRTSQSHPSLFCDVHFMLFFVCASAPFELNPPRWKTKTHLPHKGPGVGIPTKGSKKADMHVYTFTCYRLARSSGHGQGDCKTNVKEEGEREMESVLYR